MVKSQIFFQKTTNTPTTKLNDTDQSIRYARTSRDFENWVISLSFVKKSKEGSYLGLKL